MGRILAIDYGQKRAGLAVTDELQLVPNALASMPAEEVIPFLKNYMKHEKVDVIVVGQPFTMDYLPSKSERYIAPFLKQLQKAFPEIRIDRYDERFTSQLAFQTMIDAGISKKARKDKSTIDRISAVIILQSWLDARGIA
ncbi:MAG: Holliday junction resolvase RuvX [Lentimicrobium sp.]|jgi:putative Holliday junction resolvase|nr:Holliday junction resolvase RuvX [Bacteroidales bacterium]